MRNTLIGVEEAIRSKMPFVNCRANAFHLNFPNGNHISTIFGWGSYTENHMAYRNNAGLPNSYLEAFTGCETAEIMFDCSPRLEKKILKYLQWEGNQPVGHVNIIEWVWVVGKLSNERRLAAYLSTLKQVWAQIDQVFMERQNNARD